MHNDNDDSGKPRRRVRMARAVLARVELQRARLASSYAAARSEQQKFNAAASALRAAIAERLHRDNPALDRRLAAVTSQIMQLTAELLTQQERSAQRVLRRDEMRQERSSDYAGTH